MQLACAELAKYKELVTRRFRFKCLQDDYFTIQMIKIFDCTGLCLRHSDAGMYMEICPLIRLHVSPLAGGKRVLM